MEKETPVIKILFFFIFVIILIYSPFNFSSYQYPKAAGLMLVTTFFFLYAAFNRAIKPISFNIPNLFAFMLFAVISAGLIFRPLHVPGYYAAAALCVCAFFIPQFFRPSLSLIAYPAAISALVACAYGAFQVLTGELRPYSFFGNPVFFSEFLLLNFPIIAAALITTNRHKPLFFTALVFSAGFMFLAGSKGALISLLVSSIFFIYYVFGSKAAALPGFKKTGLYMSAALILLLTLFMLPGFFKSARASFLSMAGSVTTAEQLSVTGRASLARSAVLIFMDNPLTGGAPGGFKLLMQKYQSGSQDMVFVNSSYAHNDYLQLLAEFGLPGFLAFIAFIISMALFFDSRKKYLSGRDYILSAGFMASFMAGTCEALYNFPLFIFPSAFLFWLYAGFIVSAAPAESRFSAAPWLAAPALLLLLLLPLNNFPAQFISDIQLKKAVQNDKAYMPGHDKGYLDSINTYPRNIDALSLLASSYTRSGERNEALLILEKSAALYPYAADTFHNLGLLYLEQKDYDRAITAYSRAAAIYPRFARAHYGLAKVYAAMGQDDKSAAEFSLAALYDPLFMKPELDESLVYFGESTQP